jgi:hypothetical protein
VFSCEASQLTIEWLIGHVNVSVFKVFHSPSDTAGTPAVISLHMTELSIDVCSCVVLLHKEFNHCILAKYIIDSHFITVDCGNTSGVHVPNL